MPAAAAIAQQSRKPLARGRPSEGAVPVGECAIGGLAPEAILRA